MKAVTASEMQEIDRIAIEKTGIPGEVLMGFAGRSVAEYIADTFRDEKRVAVFSGTGNNGGDGFVIAYFLSNFGFWCDTYITGDIGKVPETSGIYLDICRNAGLNITRVDEMILNNISLEGYDLIVDSMLGTGFKGAPRGIIKDAIIKINGSGKKVVSVDLPSGLPSDGEAPQGEVVYADHTVTVGLPKISLVTYPGMKYAGIVHVVDIGFPRALTESAELRVDLIDREYFNSRLDFKRDADSHKGNEGHLLLIGGFDNMEGAIMMSAMAAFETGVGLATLLTTGRSRNIIAGKIPELITNNLKSLDPDKQQSVEEKDIKLFQEDLQRDMDVFFSGDRHYDVIVLGPGMGRSQVSRMVFSMIIDNIEKYGIGKVLIDGDGLYHLSEYIMDRKLPGNASFVITPHFGESSRLLGRPVQEIRNNRLQSAKDLAGKTSAVSLLKGPATIVSDGDRSLINTTGNSALAAAGSGDVLSGIIGALLLKNIDTLAAAGAGAYIHGHAADMHVKDNNINIIKATDLIRYIRKALNETIVS